MLNFIIIGVTALIIANALAWGFVLWVWLFNAALEVALPKLALHEWLGPYTRQQRHHVTIVISCVLFGLATIGILSACWMTSTITTFAMWLTCSYCYYTSYAAAGRYPQAWLTALISWNTIGLLPPVVLYLAHCKGV
jgi:hypothetical protein